MRDIMIAGIAISNDLALAGRNIRDYQRIIRLKSLPVQ